MAERATGRTVLRAAGRPGRRRRLRRPPAAGGVLHRHLGLHRLQGVRGGVQGVERRARGRVRPAGHVVRQHRRRSAPTLAARGVHRAAGGRSSRLRGWPACPPGRRSAARTPRWWPRPPARYAGRWSSSAPARPPPRSTRSRWRTADGQPGRRGGVPLADGLGRLQALHPRRLPGRLPDGALFRTEFGTVVVQQDICNGCGYCVSGCPYGVIERRAATAGPGSARCATTG